MKIARLFAFTLIIISIGAFAFTTADNVPQTGQEDCLTNLKIQERFTPNGDSINDVFSIDFPCEPETFKISIRNRDSVVVFNSKDAEFQWAGYNKTGIPCKSGIYSWEMEYNLKLKYVKRAGEILLIK